MHAAPLVVSATFVAASTACIITSNVVFFQILSEVNSQRPPERQFSFMFVDVRLFEIMRDHARLFPES